MQSQAPYIWRGYWRDLGDTKFVNLFSLVQAKQNCPTSSISYGE